MLYFCIIHQACALRYHWQALIVAGFGLGKNKGLTGAQLSRDDKQIHATQRMKKFWDINGWPQPEKGWHIDVDVESKRHGLARLKDDKIVPDLLAPALARCMKIDAGQPIDLPSVIADCKERALI